MFIQKIPFIFLLLLSTQANLFAEEPQGVPPIKVVYFTPKDKMPPEDRQERLGRVLQHVQEFYRKEMESRGHGPKTFALEWDAPGKLKIYDVKGEGERHEYPNGMEWKVISEVGRSMADRHGVNIVEEYVLILGPFIEWNENTSDRRDLRAFGGGSVAGGYAISYDAPRMDPHLISSKEPGGFSPSLGNCTIGKYSAYYIGTIAHELGHCFGYPHDCERNDQRETLGVSLMGKGNYHYADEQRGEGPGAFLTDAAALFFSTTRAFDPDFNKRQKEYHTKDWHLSITKLEATFENDKLIIHGHIDSTSPAAGIIVYNDNLDIEDDYDAKSWVAQLEESGDFHCEIGELENVPYQLRLKFIVAKNDFTPSVNYSNISGTPSLESINTMFDAAMINRFLDMGKSTPEAYSTVEDILKKLCEKYPENNKWNRKLRHLATVKNPPELADPGTVDESQTRLDLTYAKALEEKVGWYTPSRGILRDLGFMEIEGMFFESGIFAHANSRHLFSLNKKWKEFEFQFGIQDRHPGSVVFVVRGDDKELFRSKTVKSNELRMGQINVSGVDKLELITEEADNANHNDWGLWIRPTLIR